MKGARGLLTIACLLLAAPAAAGSLYRCDAPDGVRSYVSKRVAGASCVAIANASPQPRRSAATWTPPPASGSALAPANANANAPARFMAEASSGQVATSAPARRPTRLVQGKVYSYIKDGVRHYTSKPPKGVAGATALRTIRYSFLETCFACASDPGVNFRTLALNTSAYSSEIRRASRQYGVEEAVVRAIIHAESAFNPNALSRVGAQGLMQLMPATARRFGVGNPFDAAQNIEGGVQYLAWLLKRFNGDLTLAAAGYNAGEGAVDKYKGVPPYNETQRYVQRVGILAARYRGTLASAK
ncbi:MAG TPA: lytic transglycosylase domain-containing protein [Luteimonas sp.]|nr:lytic transglycosylase domain-containing protein [Luteimonas sp.]